MSSIALTQILDYTVLTNIKQQNDDKQTKIKPQIMHILIVDNSQSMGNATRECVNIIGKGLFNMSSDLIHMQPGAVIIFSDDAEFLSKNIRSVNDISKLTFPNQGMTNIAAGIKLGVDYIGSQKKEIIDTTHFIITYLSDGEENRGNLSEQLINFLRQDIIDKKQIKLSVNVIGISKPDTSLGMRVKIGLETVPMNALKSFYFAATQREMENVLSELVEGTITSLCHGKPVNIKLYGETCSFVQNSQNEISIFVSGSGTETLIVKGLIKNITINDIPATITVRSPTADDVTNVIDYMLPSLSQWKIAKGDNSIKEQVASLNKFIDVAEKYLDEMKKEQQQEHIMSAEDIGNVKMKPVDRSRIIKNLKTKTQTFSEERNKLQRLFATVGNDSSQQAQYLNGIKGKYAAKALVKADMINVTVDSVVNELKQMLSKMKDAIIIDKNNLNSTKYQTDSILSLCTAIEQLSEWVEFEENDYSNIYHLLSCIGFPSFPVKFNHSDAVQMDPFQTHCIDIEPCPVDTPSIMLANQTMHKIVSHSRKPISDGLILVDPSCPNASLVAMKSPIYRHICSVILCRDLYMYHPKMTFAIHAHSLIKVIQQYCENKSTAYLDLAIRIIYSIRKWWGEYAVKGENVDLFKRWWVEWSTVTQSEKDDCSHPVQLLLMLAAFDFGELNLDLSNHTQPLINMLNEFLARRMKAKLKNLIKDPSDDTRFIAVQLMQSLFGITTDNSPKPNEDVLIAEPTPVSVRELCQHWANVDENNKERVFAKLNINDPDIASYVNNQLISFVQTFHFGMCVQKMFKDENIKNIKNIKTWNELINVIEQVGKPTDEIVKYIATGMEHVLNTDSLVYKYIDDKMEEIKITQLAQSMFLQSTLNHDSQSRTDIDKRNVLEPSTLQDLIIDLRMAHYFEACKIKRGKWLSVIGDVTFGEAIEADEEGFTRMIGIHTHGHCKATFWALARAAKGHQGKRSIFLNKSASGANACFNKIR